MSALTYEVKDPKSPVAVWLRTTFPNHKEIQAGYRMAAGTARILPSLAVAAGTQGAAIDWWLRMLVDSAVPIDLPLTGLRLRRVPCVRAGLELLHDLGGLDGDGGVRRVDPTRFAGRPDEWWARVCYALALLVELYRAPSVDGSRLTRLAPDARCADLLALANDDEVADLIAMRDLAREHLLPALSPGPVTTGLTFEGSTDLAADADLIARGVLVDFKASQGRPRADGTRAAGLARTKLDQLLGYALMDYSDVFGLHTVAIYAIRFGHYAAWPITEV
ncbi:hypothetical protein [Plantactinospora endophytica]|uniref:PD-(D/E)XK endonuclease-like domain-containing protein n=1 Tax=Plantactinospora endophytica TaxID=673535 RepID=A0ABQ4EET6_9ACTN|nr:hypothetical protein [Plantactinospora endophytica]GIG93233.1 hypothetical protein Pen02_81690 [Plantactinospora endophytica]